METAELVAYLDGYLRIREVPDDARAANGLQVAHDTEVSRIGVAVDAAERTIALAAERGCDFLIVHHGLFWDGGVPLTGRRYRKVSALLRGGIALYGAHIPLDVHPEVGNGTVLAGALGVEIAGTFGAYQGIDLGVWGVLEIRREALAARLDELLGVRIKLMPGGRERVRRVGVLTGAGGGMIAAAIEAGLDAYITGEGAHHTYFDAMEGGINAYYGGHYATETWGVRALGEHLEAKFALPWEWLDCPTGL